MMTRVPEPFGMKQTAAPINRRPRWGAPIAADLDEA